MDLVTFIVAIISLVVAGLVLYYCQSEVKECESVKKEREECKLKGCHACNGYRLERECDTCKLTWCKYCCYRYEDDNEHLDYYFINSISKNCKKCRDPGFVIQETKLKRPVCFSCVEDDEDRFLDNVYQCDFCRRTFCEYHAKLTEYENALHSWNGECHFCLRDPPDTV